MEKLVIRVFGEVYVRNESRWGRFTSLLLRQNFIQVTSWDSTPCKAVFVDFTLRDYELLKSNPVNGRKVLILVEPPAVNPLQYKKEVLGLFDKVFTFSMEIAEEYNVQYVQFYTPTRNWNTNKIKKTGQIKFGLIAANKNSFHPKSKYAFRRHVVRLLSCSNLDFSYAGPGWNKSKLQLLNEDLAILKFYLKHLLPIKISYLRFLKRNPNLSNYRGEVESKEGFLASLNVEICIENCEGELSEKLFDALESETVPLYFGVDLEKYGIPENLTIRPQVALRDLPDFLGQITWETVEEKQNLGKEWWQANRLNWSEEWKMKDFVKKVEISLED